MRVSVQDIAAVCLSIAALTEASGASKAQTALPEVTVTPPPAATTQPKPVKRTTRVRSGPAAAQYTIPAQQAGQPASSGGAPSVTPAQQLAAKTTALDATRTSIMTRVGTNVSDLGQDTVANLPQGDDAPMDKLLLQTPGMSQDSAASGVAAPAQRARQRSISNQRNSVARRRVRLRPGPRHRLRRRYRRDRRRASRPISDCIRPASSTSRRRAARSTTAARSASTAAAKERSRRASNTAARSAIRNISSAAATSAATRASRTRRRARMRFTTTRTKGISSATSRA